MSQIIYLKFQLFKKNLQFFVKKEQRLCPEVNVPKEYAAEVIKDIIIEGNITNIFKKKLI